MSTCIRSSPVVRYSVQRPAPAAPGRPVAVPKVPAAAIGALAAALVLSGAAVPEALAAPPPGKPIAAVKGSTPYNAAAKVGAGAVNTIAPAKKVKNFASAYHCYCIYKD